MLHGIVYDMLHSMLYGMLHGIVYDMLHSMMYGMLQWYAAVVCCSGMLHGMLHDMACCMTWHAAVVCCSGMLQWHAAVTGIVNPLRLAQVIIMLQ